MIFQYYLKTKNMSAWARNLFSLLCYYCDIWPNKIQGRRINYGGKVWWQDFEEVGHSLRELKVIFFMLSPSFLCVQYWSSNWYSTPFIPVRYHLTSLERTLNLTGKDSQKYYIYIVFIYIWVFEVILKQIKLILKITHHGKTIIHKLRFIEIRLSHKILLICFYRKSLK